MTPFLKISKIIACAFIALILLPSCVVYRPSTVSIASESFDARIRVKTVAGEKYKLWWLEKKNAHLYSILNTDRKRIPINEIKEIRSPDGFSLSLDSAILRPGLFQVYTTKSANQLYGEFFKLENTGNEIIAFEQNGRDKVAVEIPIQDILNLEVENKTASNINSVLMAVGLIVGAVFTYTAIDVVINGIDIQP